MCVCVCDYNYGEILLCKEFPDMAKNLPTDQLESIELVRTMDANGWQMLPMEYMFNNRISKNS